MDGNRYSLTALKQVLKCLLENCFIKIGSQMFRQVIGIPVGSNPALFFLFHYEFEWKGQMKNIDHDDPRRFGHIYRFIDDLIAMNDLRI